MHHEGHCHNTQHHEGTHSPEAAQELQFWVNLPAVIISSTASVLLLLQDTNLTLDNKCRANTVPKLCTVQKQKVLQIKQ